MAKLKLLQFTIFLAFLSILVQSEGLKNSRILDESPPDIGNKCGNCPCDNPCTPPPSPPPPPKNKPPPPPPPSNNCPPPPSGQYQPNPPPSGQYQPNPPYIYINGPPGDLYPVDADYSGSERRSSGVAILPFLISSAVGLLAARFLVNH